MKELYLVAFESKNGRFFEENLTKERAEELYIKNSLREDVSLVFICKQLNAKIVTCHKVPYE